MFPAAVTPEKACRSKRLFISYWFFITGTQQIFVQKGKTKPLHFHDNWSAWWFWLASDFMPCTTVLICPAVYNWLTSHFGLDKQPKGALKPVQNTVEAEVLPPFPSPQIHQEASSHLCLTLFPCRPDHQTTGYGKLKSTAFREKWSFYCCRILKLSYFLWVWHVFIQYQGLHRDT